ncbi:MAG: ankyrin repeat domain-containing protein [Wolbachia sp.]
MPDNSETQNSIYVSLSNAIKSGALKKVKLLIDKCQDINKTYEKGNTLLHFAAVNSNSRITKQINDIVKVLIYKGADPNSCNSEGNRPLHLVAQSGYSSVVKTLLENGATVNVENQAGKRPLDLVKVGPHAKKIRNLLLEYGEKQLKINGVDVKEQRTGLKSDSCLDNTPTSAVSSTPASISGFTEEKRGNIQKPRDSLQPPTHAASRSRSASDFSERRTLSERVRERKSIQYLAPERLQMLSNN